MARTTLLLLSILFLLPVNASVKKLQVEYLTNPIGLDITVPRFSWQLESAERGVKQIAYQITVANRIIIRRMVGSTMDQSYSNKQKL